MKYTFYNEDVYVVGYALQTAMDTAFNNGDKKRAAIIASVFHDLDDYVQAENSNQRGFKVHNGNL